MTFLTVNKTSLIPHFTLKAATSRIFTSLFPAIECKHGFIPWFPTKRNVSTMSLSHGTPGMIQSSAESTKSLMDWKTYLFYQTWQGTGFFFFICNITCAWREEKRCKISLKTFWESSGLCKYNTISSQHLKITCKQSIALGQVLKLRPHQGKTNWGFRGSWINTKQGFGYMVEAVHSLVDCLAVAQPALTSFWSCQCSTSWEQWLIFSCESWHHFLFHFSDIC